MLIKLPSPQFFCNANNCFDDQDFFGIFWVEYFWDWSCQTKLSASSGVEQLQSSQFWHSIYGQMFSQMDFWALMCESGKALLVRLRTGLIGTNLVSFQTRRVSERWLIDSQFCSFFVISGYLIAFILDQLFHENSFKTGARIFYSRRFKRILPNYFLVLAYIIGAGIFIFRSADFEYLQDDAKWATVFASNLKPIIEEDSYFQMTTDFKPFLHTWSLAVELQFYCLAPMIFLIAKKLGRYEPIFVGFLAMASFCSYLFYKSSTIAFNLMFCRFWQFAVGGLTHWQIKQKINPFKDFQVFLLILVAIILFSSFPANICPHFLRAVVTLASSQSLIMEQLSADSVMSRILCYIGDASYSIYLIHWPVIIFAKYLNFTKDISWIIPVIIVLSLLQHHLFELPMQKFNYTVNFLVTSVFAAAVVALSFLPLSGIVMDLQHLQNFTSLEDSIKYNEFLHDQCMKHSIECGRDDFLNFHFEKIADTVWSTKCVLNYPKNNDKIAVLAGNSFMAAHAKSVVEAINESRHGWKFKKIYILSQEGCPSFDSLNEPQIGKQFDCQMSHGILKSVVQKLKPDLFITMNRLDFINNSKLALADKPENDNLTALLTKDVGEFAALTRNFVILEQNFVVEPKNNTRASVLSVIHKLSNNQSLDDLYVEKHQADSQTGISWTRIKWAAKSCANCHVVEFQDLFCNQTICDLFDRQNKLAHYCDPWHLNIHGTAKIIPRLVNFLNKLTI